MIHTYYWIKVLNQYRKYIALLNIFTKYSRKGLENRNTVLKKVELKFRNEKSAKFKILKSNKISTY